MKALSAKKFLFFSEDEWSESKSQIIILFFLSRIIFFHPPFLPGPSRPHIIPQVTLKIESYEDNKDFCSDLM
jgi:hypothetical protein